MERILASERTRERLQSRDLRAFRATVKNLSRHRSRLPELGWQKRRRVPRRRHNDIVLSRSQPNTAMTG